MLKYIKKGLFMQEEEDSLLDDFFDIKFKEKNKDYLKNWLCPHCLVSVGNFFNRCDCLESKKLDNEK
jgi:hypothetical protein